MGEDEGYESDESNKNKKRRKVDEDDDDEYEKKYRSRKDKDERKNAERKYAEKSGYRPLMTQENMTEDSVRQREDWSSRRGEMREKMRRGGDRSDWIFERAKHRKDSRQEDIRSDWYFERKQKHQERKGRESGARGEEGRVRNRHGERLRGEDDMGKFTHSKNRKGKKEKESFRDNSGEYHFDEEVRYVERHYGDEPNTRKNSWKKDYKERKHRGESIHFHAAFDSSFN